MFLGSLLLYGIACLGWIPWIPFIGLQQHTQLDLGSGKLRELFRFYGIPVWCESRSTKLSEWHGEPWEKEQWLLVASSHGPNISVSYIYPSITKVTFMRLQSFLSYNSDDQLDEIKNYVATQTLDGLKDNRSLAEVHLALQNLIDSLYQKRNESMLNDDYNPVFTMEDFRLEWNK